MSDLSFFLYDDFEPNSTEVRLLSIQPGKISDPLIGTLCKASLDTKPHYEAISYV